MDRDPAYVADIVNACNEIAAFLGQRVKEEFLSDPMAMSAVAVTAPQDPCPLAQDLQGGRSTLGAVEARDLPK